VWVSRARVGSGGTVGVRPWWYVLPGIRALSRQSAYVQSIPIYEALAPLLPKPRFKSEKCGGHSWFRTSTMPQGRYSSQGAFDIGMLNPRALEAPDGLGAAIRAIEAVCHRGHPEVAGMVAALNSHSDHTLEYIISGTLRVPIRPCALPVLIIPPSSAGGGGIREAPGVVSYRVSHIQEARCGGCH
jgi:hypothetical protein